MLKNEWDFWVFPRIVEQTGDDAPGEAAMKKSPLPVYLNHSDGRLSRRWKTMYPFIQEGSAVAEREALYITDQFDQHTIALLEQGHRVLLLGNSHFDGHKTDWGAGRSEYGRGTKIYSHPLTEKMPHNGWCDIPFAQMISGTEALHGNRSGLGIMMDMRPWPEQVHPLIMGFPSYKDEEPQLYSFLLEATAGSGKFITTTFDLGQEDPATTYFFDEVLRYMTGSEFAPKAAVPVEFLKGQQQKKAEIRKFIVEFQKDDPMPNLKRPDEQ
jgi:hypothetical protein